MSEKDACPQTFLCTLSRIFLTSDHGRLSMVFDDILQRESISFLDSADKEAFEKERMEFSCGNNDRREKLKAPCCIHRVEDHLLLH